MGLDCLGVRGSRSGGVLGRGGWWADLVVGVELLRNLIDSD